MEKSFKTRICRTKWTKNKKYHREYKQGKIRLIPVKFLSKMNYRLIGKRWQRSKEWNGDPIISAWIEPSQELIQVKAQAQIQKYVIITQARFKTMIRKYQPLILSWMMRAEIYARESAKVKNRTLIWLNFWRLLIELCRNKWVLVFQTMRCLWQMRWLSFMSLSKRSWLLNRSCIS